ncbi:hypothetical protein [Chryseobacterium sp. Tr-659]|uniref:hypothetical protein n=1 Tax=Chryseobacterium sp. Tr-659 TaxID=2608340 RepID=UPI001E36F7FB|nr:hypothetical protein [Chryseobacterium sp. Tr-659]
MEKSKFNMETENKIYFLHNPYPNDHKTVTFNWYGRIDEDESVWLDFHLKTENYYTNDEDLSDWDSKIVWRNYHTCTLLSTY